MNIYINPLKTEWEKLLQRPLFSTEEIENKVFPILNEVKTNGDKALIHFAEQFDGVKISHLKVSEQEFIEAENLVSTELKKALEIAKQNIYSFHKNQLLKEEIIETTLGVKCWRKSIGIQKVGLYIPGGTAPLFSTVLMLAIPAKIAGCNEISLCTPPNKEGKIHPAILYAAKIAGITNIYKVGGAQAIGALSFGTETINKVFKIFGPGNQYVTAAKNIVNRFGTAIDMPAGPSEVLVIADESSNPVFVAADLLSQAEHGKDSQVVLLTTNESVAKNVKIEVEKQVKLLPRVDFANTSLSNSKIIVLENIEEIIQVSDLYAPEHLIIATENAREIADKITNSGSVFIGHYTPESAGDYASGTNHTLPTNGFSSAYSGVSVDSFVKKVTFQEISKEGLLNLGPTIEILAENEQLEAHKNAVSVRLRELNNK